MTTLTATAQAATSTAPASVLLVVSGAPSPPATAYTSNFSAGLDSWATSGTGNTLTQDTGTNPAIGRLRLLGNPGPATATRTVTGLTVSAPYRLRMSYYTSAGQMRPGVTGMTAASWVSGGSPGFGGSPTKYVTVDYNFTATATSHVITVDAQKATNATASVYFHTVTVTNTSSWLGTTITRTDANGTNVLVRNPGALDTAGGTMTLTDYESALAGGVTYTVTDGSGGTATATTRMEMRRNQLVNPSFETNVNAWTGIRGTLSKVGLAPAGSGSSCMRYTVTDNSQAGYAIEAVSGTSAHPYPPNTAIQVGYAVRLQVMSTLAMQAQLYEYDSGGTLLGLQTSTPVTVSSGVWKRVDQLLTTQPTTAYVRAAVGFGLASSTSVIWDIDACYLGQPGTYFDGDTPAAGSTAYAWLGTVQASASVETTSAPAATAPSLTVPATVTAAAPPTFAAVTVVTDYQEAAESQGTVHVILGRNDKLSNPGVLLNRTGQLEFLCLDYDDATAVRNMLKTAAVALLRQPDYPGLDLYFIARGVSIAPAEPSLSRHWVCTVAYDEVPRP